ncbi:MAG: amidohydrolase family protein, partial [Chloroflexota bacterium]
MTIQSLLIQNAKVYTVDEANPTAEAVVVSGNKIVFVGSNEGAKQHASEDCRVVDANGRSLLPGFIDSHFHLAWGAKKLLEAKLGEVESMAELKSTLQAWAKGNPDRPWVLGTELSYALPSPDTPLTRHHLDEIESERPLALTAFDMHSMFVNSKALEVMGLTHGTDQIMENGIVPVDDNG